MVLVIVLVISLGGRECMVVETSVEVCVWMHGGFTAVVVGLLVVMFGGVESGGGGGVR